MSELAELIMGYSKIAPPLSLPRPLIIRPGQRTVGRIHAARPRLGPELIDQLVRDYEASESTAALCRSYGLGKGTVISLLTERGVTMRGQGLPDDLMPEATRLYVEESWPLRKIGPRLGCCADAVRLELLRSGVVLRKPWERGTNSAQPHTSWLEVSVGGEPSAAVTLKQSAHNAADQ